MSFNSINFNNINMTNFVSNDDNSTYESLIKYNNENLVISTGKMCLYDVDNNKTIRASFIKNNNDFYTFMYKLDKHIIDTLFEQSEQLLGIKFKRENIKDLYRKTILLPKNLHECPTIKIHYDGLVELKQNCEINMEIFVEKIVFEKNKCFLKCTAQQINLTPNVCDNNEILFTDHQNTYSDIINYIENV